VVALDGADIYASPAPRRQLGFPGRGHWARWRCGGAPGAATQRGVARALARAPRALLLDQPASGLGREAREAVFASLRAVRERGVPTLLYATTDFADVLDLADRAAVISEGALRQVGSPRDLYDRPADPEVAGLGGEINRLPGQIVAIEDDMARIRLDAGVEVEAEVREPATTVGEHCLLCIRPERVAVAALPASSLGDGALAAEVAAAEFRGDSIRLRLLIGAGPQRSVLIAKRHPGLPPHDLRPGKAVSVAWQPHDALLFRVGTEPG
jgi:ABC-type Fe3+/spermidine/putrescine transport system ATPase subunit